MELLQLLQELRMCNSYYSLRETNQQDKKVIKLFPLFELTPLS